MLQLVGMRRRKIRISEKERLLRKLLNLQRQERRGKKAAGNEAEEAEEAATDDDAREGTGDSVRRVLCLKRGPKKFVQAMRLLNENQTDAVVEMGFGGLLHFKLSYIPAKLAFEILDRFDQDGCGVVYQRGILHVGHDDVQATLGLPKGDTRIVRNGHQKSNKFIDEIADSGGRDRSNMGATFLMKKMLSDAEGGTVFRKIFLILVDTILINPSGDGYLHTQIEEVIHDIDRVKEYNWCGYVIDSLLLGHRNWARDKDKAFSGPVSFLVPCYADRIVLRSRLVTRCFPTIKGWTSTLLHQRQKMELEPGPFGRGIEEPIFDPLRSNLSVEAAKVDIGSSSGVKAADSSDRVAQGRRTLMNLMDKAADALGELMKGLEDGADTVKNDGCSKIAAKCSLKMMGVQEMEPDKNVNEVESMSQAMEEDELDDPSFLAAVEKVMRVAEQRHKWKTDGPSFDLGFEFGGRNVS